MGFIEILGQMKIKLNVSEINLEFLIKFEYSSKLKSEKFYNKTDIIGPRSTFFSKDFNINDCELIDKSCLSKVGQIFFYDERYALNV